MLLEECGNYLLSLCLLLCQARRLGTLRSLLLLADHRLLPRGDHFPRFRLGVRAAHHDPLAIVVHLDKAAPRGFVPTAHWDILRRSILRSRSDYRREVDLHSVLDRVA